MNHILGTSLDGISNIVIFVLKDSKLAVDKEDHQEVFEERVHTIYHDISKPLSKVLMEKLQNMSNLDDLLIVCLLQGSSMNLKDLAVSLKPFISNQGVVFKSSSSQLSPTELLFDFAGEGLFPHPQTKILTDNNFSADTFQVHLTKKPYIVRVARKEDLQSVKELDENSWQPKLQYPAEIVRHWVTNRPTDVLIMEDENGQVLGAMFTQVVYTSFIDAKPWRESMLDSTEKCTVSHELNKNSNEPFKQLLRVSTKQGGKNINQTMPGVALRDFALNVAISQGITKVTFIIFVSIIFSFLTLSLFLAKVLAITRAIEFKFREEKGAHSTAEECYENFMHEITEGTRLDRGLNFHLSRGADLVRKTVENWIPEDAQNGGFGVIIRYALVPGSGKVKSKVNHLEAASLKSVYDVCDVVTKTVSKITSVEVNKISGSAPFIELGMDSLSLMELVNGLSAECSLDLSETIVFEHPSVFDLSYALACRLGMQDRTTLAEEQRSKLSQEFCNTFLPTKKQNESSDGVDYDKGKDSNEIIAITGMSCRLSGGINSPEDLWSVVQEGKSLAGPVPFSRWDVEANNIEGELGLRASHGSFVQDAEYFDPAAFKISLTEAKHMDPQHRLLLECSYLALLDAGYSKGLSELRGRNVGVFIGISGSDMVEVNLKNKGSKEASVYEAYNAASASASGRVSFVFNFKGPCITVS